MDEALAVTALAALALGIRLRIFRALVGAGPEGMTPGALAALLDVPGSTLSLHLRELMRAGLVTQRRDGRRLRYSPHLARMNELLAYMGSHCCHGAPCDLVVPAAGTRCQTC